MKQYNRAQANDGNWGAMVPESTIAAWENAYATGNYGPYNDVFPEVDWWKELVKNVGYEQAYKSSRTYNYQGLTGGGTAYEHI